MAKRNYTKEIDSTMSVFKKTRDKLKGILSSITEESNANEVEIESLEERNTALRVSTASVTDKIGTLSSILGDD